MSASRTVARNVRLLRIAKGLKQFQAAEQLVALGGPAWSGATWSAIERSAETDRVRSFTADEIAWLATMFDVKPGDLFEEISSIPCPNCQGIGQVMVSPPALPEVHPGQVEIPAP